MAEIIPAIIGQDFVEIEDKIHQVERAVDWVHLDIMNGSFTSQRSWQTPEDLQFLDGKTKIEVHLMILKPERVVRTWAKIADRILIHVEAIKHSEDIIALFTGQTAQAGLVFNLLTSPDKFKTMIARVGLVQLMAIAEIGEQGHPFDERVLDKIKLLRQENPDVKIQVDGGINLDNAKKLTAAGADNLIVGSAIWQSPDPLAAIESFQKLQATI